MPPNLKEIRAAIAKLERQAEAIVQKDKKKAVDEVIDLVNSYKITAQDLGFELSLPGKRKRGRPKRKSQATYEKGDLTWSGLGRRPRWVADVIAKESKGGLEKYRVK